MSGKPFPLVLCVCMFLLVHIRVCAAWHGGGCADDSTEVTWNEQLEGVVVTARRPVVVQKGDTAVIDAGMLKTAEDAYLKDLIRRVPGLEYDEKAGTLKFNGKSLAEIQLNGKPFFRDNMKTPLECLPARLISKLKVYNRQSDTEKALGIRSGIEYYVLDLQTKKEFDKTYMNSVAAYGGSQDKWQGEIVSNYFETGGNNFSLNGSVGNKDATTPGKGNMNGSVGTNFSHSFSGKVAVSGNLQYGRNRSSGMSSGYSEEYLQESSRYSLSQGKNTSDSHNLGGYATVNWTIDRLTELNADGSYNFTKGRTASENRDAAVGTPLEEVDVKSPFYAFDRLDAAQKINEIRSMASSEDRSQNYTFNVNLIRRFKAKGPVVSVSAGNSAAWNRSRAATDNVTRFFRLAGNSGTDSLLTQRRLSRSPSDNSSFHAGVTFVQPVSGSLKLQLSYNYTRTASDNTVNMFDRGSGDAVTMIDSLSSFTHSRTVGHDFGVSVNYDRENLLASISGNFVPGTRSMKSRTGDVQTDTAMHITDFRSDANIQYRWKDSRMLSFSYMFSTTQPDIMLLVPRTDNTDPLNVSRGNPGLKTSSSHYFNLRYEDTKNGLSLYGACNLLCDNIAQAVVYNGETGVRTARPVNINGNRSASGYVNWWRTAWRVFTFSLSGMLSYNHQVSLVSESGTSARSVTDGIYATSSLGVNYTPSWGTFYFRTSYSHSMYGNSLRGGSNYTRTVAASLNASVNLPCYITLETDADYRFNSGNMTSKDDRNVMVWNMKAVWRFMKERRMELSLAWNDILSNRKSYYRNASSAGFSETYSKVVKSFFVVGLAYKFQVGG